MNRFIPLLIISVVMCGCDRPTEPENSSSTPTMKSHAGAPGYQIVDLGGWDYMNTRSINNRGQIVGWGSSPAFDDHAFLWDGDQLVDLFQLSGWFGQPFDMNERGQAVGLSFDTWDAVLWDHGTLVDLVGLALAEGINNR